MANIDEIHKHIADRQIAFVYHKGKYLRKTQVRAGPISDSNIWIPKEGLAPIQAKTAFRHIRRRGYDRRIGLFRFRITRDDGVIIDLPALSAPPYGDGINIYSSAFEWVGAANGYTEDYSEFWTQEEDVWYYEGPRFGGDTKIAQWSYNTITKIWTVPFFSWVTPKRNKKDFWVRFLGKEDTLACYYANSIEEYPEYTYKDEDRFQVENLIKPRFYEVVIPHYKVIYSDTRVPSPDFPDDGAYGAPCSNPGVYEYGYCNAAKVQALEVAVESSIPYTVSYLTSDAVPTAFYYGNYTYYDSTRTVEECIADASEHWYQSDWYGGGSRWTPGADYATPVSGTIDRVFIPNWVRVTTTKGDASNNIVTSPIDSNENITPPPYTSEMGDYSIDAFYTGTDPFELPRVCIDGTVYFPLTFEVFRLKYSVTVSVT